jgi:hypothetical protein
MERGNSLAAISDGKSNAGHCFPRTTFFVGEIPDAKSRTGHRDHRPVSLLYLQKVSARGERRPFERTLPSPTYSWRADDS